MLETPTAEAPAVVGLVVVELAGEVEEPSLFSEGVSSEGEEPLPPGLELSPPGEEPPSGVPGVPPEAKVL